MIAAVELRYKDTPKARWHLRQIRKLHRSHGGASRLTAKGGVLLLVLDSEIVHPEAMMAPAESLGEVSRVP